MGTNQDSEQGVFQKYKKGIYEMGEYFVHRIFRVWLYPEYIFGISPTGRKQKEVLNNLHKFTTNVIRERRKERSLSGNKFAVEDFVEENAQGTKKRLAMLDLLLSAESEGKIDEVGIREEVDTFMFEVEIVHVINKIYF